MQAQDLEPQFETFLRRLVPGIEKQWRGADAASIDELERIAGRPLPRFYRWFLTRMGGTMGPLAYPTLDFSASRVLSCYASRLVAPDPRLLLIGHESNQHMPLHAFYDLDHPARDDARVTLRHEEGGDLHDQFETLREMIAWGKLLVHRVETCRQTCTGILMNDNGEVIERLASAMSRLGFTSPIETGPRCSVFEAKGAAMVGRTSLSNDLSMHAFVMGGPSTSRLRRMLGEISERSGLELEIFEWAPPLA